jgi:hypothetical protein
LRTLQDWLTRLPVRLTEAEARLVHWAQVLRPVMRAYRRAFDPAALAPTAEEVAMMEHYSPRMQYWLSA